MLTEIRTAPGCWVPKTDPASVLRLMPVMRTAVGASSKRSSALAQHTVYLHARAAERPRDHGRPMTLSRHAPDTSMIKPSLAAEVNTRRLRSRNFLALPHFDEAPLHLGDHTEHG